MKDYIPDIVGTMIFVAVILVCLVGIGTATNYQDKKEQRKQQTIDSLKVAIMQRDCTIDSLEAILSSDPIDRIIGNGDR
jgi:hypothetical protein